MKMATSKRVFIIVMMMMMVAEIAGDTDYCQICADHVMCLFPEPEPGANCSPYIDGGVSEEDVDVILKSHNAFRERVARGEELNGNPGPQPQAANMRKMVWDSELATYAQRWVDQCIGRHDDCHVDPRFLVGQNIVLVTSTEQEKPDWRKVVESFYKQVEIFNSDWISPFHYDEYTACYSQLSWAESYLVGCGRATYKTAADPLLVKQFFTCNYGPTGNTNGTDMYLFGRPCTKCPPDTLCPLFDYPWLCADKH